MTAQVSGMKNARCSSTTSGLSRTREILCLTSRKNFECCKICRFVQRTKEANAEMRMLKGMESQDKKMINDTMAGFQKAIEDEQKRDAILRRNRTKSKWKRSEWNKPENIAYRLTIRSESITCYYSCCKSARLFYFCSYFPGAICTRKEKSKNYTAIPNP